MQRGQDILLEINLIYTQKHTVREESVQAWDSAKHTDPPEQINTLCLAKLILLSASTD